MGRKVSVLALALLVLNACWTIDRADLTAISRAHGLEMSEAPLEDENVIGLGSLQVAKGGFYLLGLVPIVKISLHDTIEELAIQAKKLGADGVCNIHYRYNPPNPLKFIAFPLPDWSAGIQAFGMAFRHHPSSPPREPGLPLPPK